ncbi:MAG: kynureninase [Chitinophagales bacterium]|nr:kynureninase [Chitinophagales bacterium]
MKFENNQKYAQEADAQDPLKSFRSKFHIPQHKGKDCIYFTGNSLGLLPKNTEKAVLQELEDWRKMGVEGHMNAKNPWFYYHNFVSDSLAKIVGAKPTEVVAMNSLTVNLNLMMVSFYQPNGNRKRILVENNPFPSDYYAIEQQIKFHGHDPEECIIELKPGSDEHSLSTTSIIKSIEKYGDEIALVLIGGVNFYTGQFFDLEKITTAAHDAGAFVGFDLAHAIGNVPLALNNWGVDFAVWCTYKYLNSGPGSVGGAFVHERHGNNPELPRMSGWWGNDEESRFEFPKNFEPQTGAAGWQMSNAPVLSLAAHKAALEIFDEAGMQALREKSIQLTAYMEFILKDIWKRSGVSFTVITPKSPEERGCQLSILTGPDGKKIFEKLTAEGVVADWRNPNVIRVAPVPLYNTFEDIYNFGRIIESASN